MAVVAASWTALLFILPASISAVRLNDQFQVEENHNDIDWSTTANPAGRNVVTEAQDQGGHCNSCYVWAAVGSIESRAAIESGEEEPMQLSVQQALDCARKSHMDDIGKGKLAYLSSRGCSTGFPKPILQYAVDEGFMLASDYPVPYSIKGSAARDGPCEVDSDKIAWNPSDWKVKQATKRDTWETNVMKALAEGPVAIGIAKDSHGLGSDPEVRAGGIATTECKSQANDHAVLLVGFGEMDGKPYWKIRNSWGSVWGDHGFFKIPRGSNFCGAETTAAWLEKR